MVKIPEGVLTSSANPAAAPLTKMMCKSPEIPISETLNAFYNIETDESCRSVDARYP